jgi:hypothetical protein
MALWRIVDPGQHHPAPTRRREWAWRVGVFSLGLVITGTAAMALWHTTAPDTLVRTRIVADGAEDQSGRAALSEVALRLASAPDREVMLQQGGDALVITLKAHDAAQAKQRSASLVDAILNAPVAAPGAPLAAETPAADPRAALQAQRAQLAAAADAVDARASAASASLASLARDIASANRIAADRKPGRDTLDKGQAALADLQLKRLELVTKYQDTYPAVLVMDVQIHDLQKFLSDEARRVDAHPAAPDPSDALLAAERDRLRSELAQLDVRRQELAANLHSIDLKLAGLPAVTVAAATPIAPAAPVLIATATTMFPDTDARLTTVPAVVAGGLLLSGLSALWPRRRRSLSSALPHGLLLEAVPMTRIPGGHARPLPPPERTDTRFVPSLESLEAE